MTKKKPAEKKPRGPASGRKRLRASMPHPEPANPWDRQPGETETAFATFCIYRGLHPFDRRHARVVEERNRLQPGRPISTEETTRLATLWKWSTRARHYDEMISQKATESEVDVAVRIRREHIAIAHKLQQLGAESIDALLEAVEKGGTIPPRDVIRAAVEGIKLERLVRGETTENLSHTRKLSLTQVAAEMEEAGEL